MLAIQIGVVLALLIVCSFAPGFFLVRHLRWNPLEKLCGSIAVSLIFLYLVSFAIYNFAGSAQSAWFWVVSGACLVLGLLAWSDLRRLAGTLSVRRALSGFAFLLLWTFLLLAMIRNFSGAFWSGDWIEHFQRTLFFVHHFPHDTYLYGNYLLPARPPMMNLLAAFFLAQTADRFEIFQVVFAFLNLLVFLPCCLIMPALLPGRKKWRVLPLVVLFALSPVVMQNVTYAWTKVLTAFFVVLALSLYLAGLRKGRKEGWRVTAAFAVMTAGLLVHYSAGPYLAFLGLHYGSYAFWKRPHKVRELGSITAVCLLLLLTWFGWSVAVYGTGGTFASNTSVISSQQHAGKNMEKIAANLLDTVVPIHVRDSQFLRAFDQSNDAGRVRDYAFVFYQTNLIFAMGLVGGPVVIGLLWKAFRRPRAENTERWFWGLLIPFVIVIGVAVVGERDSLGVAHLTLQTIEILGLTLLAAWFPLPRVVAVAILAGCVIDFSLGVYLQGRVENLENTPESTIFTGLNPELQVGAGTVLTYAAWSNWFAKHQYSLCEEWSQQLDSYPPENMQAHNMALEYRQTMEANQSGWYGWYPRHGGTIEFLGDHLAGPRFGGAGFGGLDAPSLLLLTAFFALMYRFARRDLMIKERIVHPKRQRHQRKHQQRKRHRRQKALTTRR